LPVKGSIATIIIAIVAGLLVGFALSTLAYRYRILRVPGESVVTRMEREVGLTPAQHQQVHDIMRNTRFKVMELRHEMQEQRHKLFLDAYDQIRGILTPEQQQKFDRAFPRPFLFHGGGHWHHGAEEEEQGTPPSTAASPAAPAPQN
jgi:Spy/CpxP family protein refolding chaperone